MTKMMLGVVVLFVVTCVVPAMPDPVGNTACAGEDCKTACDGVRVACRMVCSNSEGNCIAECSRYDDEDDDTAKRKCIRACKNDVRGCYDKCEMIAKGCKWACD